MPRTKLQERAALQRLGTLGEWKTYMAGLARVRPHLHTAQNPRQWPSIETRLQRTGPWRSLIDSERTASLHSDINAP
jgi:hypothetical protein